MNNLTTRKIVLGVLMTLMLAFGMQSVVQAVIVSIDTNVPGSPTGSSKVEVQPGQSFEITFTFTLNARELIRHPLGGYADQGVASTSALNDNRVDSAGYPATRITGTRLQTFENLRQQVELMQQMRIHTRMGRFIENERVVPDLVEAVSALSDNSGYVYDSAGNCQSFITTDPMMVVLSDVDEALLGNRVRVLPAHWESKIPDTQRYYYDEEVIEISHDAGLSLELKSNGLQINASGTTNLNRRANRSSFIRHRPNNQCQCRKCLNYSDL